VSILNLLRCPDETFLSFLCEIIHPIVRSDEGEVQRLAEANAARLRLRSSSQAAMLKLRRFQARPFRKAA
jgi:hypothetical protein